MSVANRRTWKGKAAGAATGAQKRPAAAAAAASYKRLPSQAKRTSLQDDIEILYTQANTILVAAKKHRVRLLVDDREHGEEVAALLARLDPSIVEPVHALAGDFILLFEGRMFRVIERKRMDDLCSSIKDGRTDKQRASMALLFRDVRMNPLKRSRCIWLIEKMSHDKVGCDDQELTQAEKRVHVAAPLVAVPLVAGTAEVVAIDIPSEATNDVVDLSDDLHWLYGEPESIFEGQSLNRQALLGSMVNKITRDSMSTFTTESAEYTIMFLLKMMLSMHKNGAECAEQVAGQEAFDISQLSGEHQNMSAEEQAAFLESRQLVQARPIADELAQAQLAPASATFVLQLMQLNQMTATKAIALVRRYPTPRAWSIYLCANETTPQVVVDEVGGMPIAEKGKQARAFGPQLACRLINSFWGGDWVVKGKKIKARTIEDEADADEEQE